MLKPVSNHALIILSLSILWSFPKNLSTLTTAADTPSSLSSRIENSLEAPDTHFSDFTNIPFPSMATSYAPDVVPLALKNGAIEAKGMTIMDALIPGAFATADSSESDHGAVIVGLPSPSGPSSLVDLRIGQLNSNKMLACARCKLWWMTPEWRDSTCQLPPETQFLLTEIKSGPAVLPSIETVPVYALLLPLIDGDFRATLRPPPTR